MSTSMNEAKKASSVVGKKLQQTSMWLYGKDTQTWLTQAYEQAVQAQKERQQEENKIYPVVRTYDEDYYHEDEESISSSSNNSSASSQSSSSSSSSIRNNKEDDETTGQQHQSNRKEEKVHQAATAPPKTQGTVNLLTIPKTPKKKKIKNNNNNNKKMRRMQQEINVHYANLMTTQIPVTVVSSGDESTTTTFYQMDLPSALLSKQEQLYGSLVSRSRSYLDLSTALSEKSNMVVVLILQSGRFAGGIFQHEKCIDHKSFQHYTVRKGQGKAQSTQDANKKAKSMGSQLRRQGEVKLQTEVKELLGTEWAERIRTASLILISCPKTMMGTMFGEEGGAGVLLSRNDPRVRKIPMTVGRPTFEAVQVVHQVLMKVMVRQTDGPAETLSSSLADEKEGEEKTTGTKEGTETSMQPAPELIVQEESAPEPEIIELTPLHELCRDGDHEGLLRHLISSSESSEDSINQLAGPDFMAPLHYAAAASNVPEEDAGACVYDLLVSGGADPTILDSRLRPPYFVAANDKIREAFRRARATLGEGYCDWAASKVGPPLSDSDIQDKKAKEAEKRRRKKAKAKERKAKEKEAQDAATKELERQKAEEEAHAKRGGKTCDMCQKPIRGKKNAFKRLEYVYCSTDCVTKHKRELMASAAMARFGG